MVIVGGVVVVGGVVPDAGMVVVGGVVSDEISARVKPATFKEAVLQFFIVAKIASFSAWSIDNFQRHFTAVQVAT